MKNPTTAQGAVGLFAILAGLCALFALAVTITDAWQEHVQQRWPEVTATIKMCSVDPHVQRQSRSPAWRIVCRITYRADANQVETHIRSRSTASGWGGDKERMRQWVAQHRSGSSIVIRYDPADASTAVLTETDMPSAAPRTRNNLTLLLIASITCLVSATIARRLREAPIEHSRSGSARSADGKVTG